MCSSCSYLRHRIPVPMCPSFILLNIFHYDNIVVVVVVNTSLCIFMSISGKHPPHQSLIPSASSPPCHFASPLHKSVSCRWPCKTKRNVNQYWVHHHKESRPFLPDSPNNATGSARLQCNQIPNELSGLHVPQLDRAIVRARDDEPRIKLQTSNRRLVLVGT